MPLKRNSRPPAVSVLGLILGSIAVGCGGAEHPPEAAHVAPTRGSVADAETPGGADRPARGSSDRTRPLRPIREPVGVALVRSPWASGEWGEASFAVFTEQVGEGLQATLCDTPSSNTCIGDWSPVDVSGRSASFDWEGGVIELELNEQGSQLAVHGAPVGAERSVPATLRPVDHIEWRLAADQYDMNHSGEYSARAYARYILVHRAVRDGIIAAGLDPITVEARTADRALEAAFEAIELDRSTCRPRRTGSCDDLVESALEAARQALQLEAP